MAPAPRDPHDPSGWSLPPPPRPAGSYSPVVMDGGLAWVSGQIATDTSGVLNPGRVDLDVDVATAQRLARQAALQGLSALAAATGGLEHIRRVLRVVVYVASAPGFVRQHEVANGATELLIEVFGEAGRPARAAVGVAALPLNAPVEVELLVATQ